MDRTPYSAGDLRFAAHDNVKRIAVWSGIPWATRYKLTFDAREARGNWEHVEVIFEWDGKTKRELIANEIVWDIEPNKSVARRTIHGRHVYIADACLTLEPTEYKE